MSSCSNSALESIGNGESYDVGCSWTTSSLYWIVDDEDVEKSDSDVTLRIRLVVASGDNDVAKSGKLVVVLIIEKMLHSSLDVENNPPQEEELVVSSILEPRSKIRLDKEEGAQWLVASSMS